MALIQRFLPKTWEQRLFLLLVLLYLLPIWIVSYFPSQDGPSHVYNSFILKEYGNTDEYPLLSEYYDLNRSPFPNWLSHATMLGLIYVVDPLVAEKILVSGYVLLFLLGGWYLLASIDLEKRWYAFLLFPFVYNYLLQMGFYNFCYSLAFFFLAIGYWWRHRNHFDVSRAVTLNLLLTLCYFSHLVSTLLALLSIAVLWLITLSRRRIKKHLLHIPLLLPSLVLPLWFVWSHGTASAGNWTRQQLWNYVADLEVLTSFSTTQLRIGSVVVTCLILCKLLTLIRDKVAWNHGKPHLRLAQTDGFLLLSLIFLVLYWYIPDGLSGGGFMKHRLSLYPALILLPWFTIRLNRMVKWGGIVVLILLALINLSYLLRWYPKLDADMQEFRAGLEEMPIGGTVLPLAFDRNGQCLRIGMFLHAIGYYCAYTGAVEWDNYEATTDYFPVRYKPGLNRPDTGVIEGNPQAVPIEGYVDLVDTIHTWAMPPDIPIAKQIEQHYSLAFSQGRTRIYRRIQ